KARFSDNPIHELLKVLGSFDINRSKSLDLRDRVLLTLDLEPIPRRVPSVVIGTPDYAFTNTRDTKSLTDWALILNSLSDLNHLGLSDLRERKVDLNFIRREVHDVEDTMFW